MHAQLKQLSVYFSTRHTKTWN